VQRPEISREQFDTIAAIAKSQAATLQTAKRAVDQSPFYVYEAPFFYYGYYGGPLRTRASKDQHPRSAWLNAIFARSPNAEHF